MKILHLTLKKKWFDLIASGEKTTEFREFKLYWRKRFTKKNGIYKKFDEVHFTNGYGKNRPFVIVEFKGFSRLADCNNYYCKHGEFFPGEKFAIFLGKVLEVKKC